MKLDKYAAHSILAWLIRVEGTVTVHDGVARTEDGMYMDLRQAFAPEVVIGADGLELRRREV